MGVDTLVIGLTFDTPAFRQVEQFPMATSQTKAKLATLVSIKNIPCHTWPVFVQAVLLARDTHLGQLLYMGFRAPSSFLSRVCQRHLMIQR
jgi:hypothetical protein